MEFGQWIRDARARKQWSRSALARRAGLPENTIRRLETGETVPRYPTLLKIIEALGEVPPVLASYSESLESLGSILLSPIAHKPVKKNSTESLSQRSTSRRRAA